MIKEKYMDMAICAFVEYQKEIDTPGSTNITRSDVDAVRETLTCLSVEEKNIVYAIYITYPIKKVIRRKISSRVRTYSIEHGLSESSIWRVLKKARRLYAIYRGLI